MPKQYKIEGDHPILKRVDWLATGIPDLICKLKELDEAGYEIDIEMQLQKQCTCGEAVYSKYCPIHGYVG